MPVVGQAGSSARNAHQLLQRDGERVVGHRDGLHRPPVRPVLPLPVQAAGLDEQVEPRAVVEEGAGSRHERAVQQDDVGAPPDSGRSAWLVEREGGHPHDQVAAVDQSGPLGAFGQRRVADDRDRPRRVVAGVGAHQVTQDLPGRRHRARAAHRPPSPALGRVLRKRETRSQARHRPLACARSSFDACGSLGSLITRTVRAQPPRGARPSTPGRQSTPCLLPSSSPRSAATTGATSTSPSG